MKKTLTILLFLSIGFMAGSLPYKVRYLTADDGLSRNLVNHIFRDSRGFIWIATAKGLDRYDGYNFVQYSSSKRDNYLPNDVVMCIEEDFHGNLWLGTDNGLYVLNYKTGAITPASSQVNSGKFLMNKSYTFIRKDAQNQLWVGHNLGVTLLTPDDNGIYKTEEVYSGENITSILLFNGNILLSQVNEVFRIIKGSKHLYTRIPFSEKVKDLGGEVNAMFQDNGFIWFGTATGLFKYEISGDKLTHFIHNPFNNNSISTNTITDITKDADGQLLIGTLIGLNIYDYQTNTFTRLTSEKDEKNVSLNNNFISSILAVNNIIWIGTEKGGVNILVPDLSFFINVAHNPEFKGSLSKNPVNAIYEDTEGDLWVGTVEGGINFRKKGTQEFKHIEHVATNPQSLSHNSVSCICQDYAGNYWFGTWGFGINFLHKKDKNKPVFKRFFDAGKAPNSLLNNFVAAVASDSLNKGVWIGMRNGLDFMDIQSGKIIHVLSGLKTHEAIRFITGMFIDNQNRLWIGTGNGLFCINLNKSKIRENRIEYRHFHYELSNPASDVIEKINCILQTKDGKLWFGSNGNGIYYMEGSPEKPTFKRLDINQGLIDNVVYGMLEDDAGTIWISTDKGLSALDPGKMSFRNFTTIDGLASNQFYWDAFFRGRNGMMYFGHVDGYTVFDPLKYIPSATKNSVSITGIAVLNENIFPGGTKKSSDYLRFDHTALKTVVLKESDKIFSVEFSALNYYQPEKIKYAYRLKGFDNEWKEVSADRRFANFTNIKYGKYNFEVKCTNADGSWSDIVTSIGIRVYPPFYKTWWFISLLIGLMLYIAYTFTTYRIKSLKKQEIHLKQLVEERTREIEAQKEKVQEATLDKIAFFTNITHEFRTPVTLILGPVERALKLSTNPKVLEQLNIVRRNSKLLLSLINQLMDFRKVDSGKMILSKSKHNFIDFLENIILPFEDMGKDRGIVFKKQFRILPPEILFDRDSMQKLLGNLLSNAIKFTPDDGTITIIASTYTDKSDMKDKLYMAIKDNGKGIPPEDLEKIFERFYQSKVNEPFAGSGQSGTGIGLYLCKKIIELYEGKIEATNNISGGSAFKFIIPLDKQTSGTGSLITDEKQTAITREDEHDLIQDETPRIKPLLLIVEDNSDMRQYVKSLLSEEYQIIEAANGVAGLLTTKQHLPDLIISDIMMPEMDGIELCKELKTNFNTSHIPVVLLTAKSSSETQIEGFHSGADAFLIKPFDEGVLKAVLDNLTEKRRKIQQNFIEKMDVSVLDFEEESHDKKFIDKALKVIRENYTNPEFDVTEFIEEMGISRSLLHKKLTNLTGQSASRFVRSYRLNTARELIIKNRETHAMNISEIAYQVGFNDPKYFTRCFTKQFGIQPSNLLDEK